MNFNSNNSNKNEFSQNISSQKEDSTIKSGESFTKKNTIEYNNIFSKKISSSSQNIKNKHNESDLKNTPTRDNNDNNDINTFISNTNTLEGSYNKNIYTSPKKSLNEENQKLDSKNHSSFFSTDNNNNNTKLKNSQNFFFVSKKSKYPKNPKLIRHYKKWKGDNYFPCYAGAIEGPCSFRPTLLSWCAITLPIILFFIFDVNYLIDEYTIFIPIIIVILYFISFIFLIIASFVDPGIIRKFNLAKEDKSKDYIKKNSSENIIKRNDSKIFQLGYINIYKYCSTCGIIRPKRSTHCSDCNNCVERLDHHCPWIGNCAGKRNYIYFYIFLVFLNILTILMIFFCVLHIISKVNDFSNMNEELPKEEKIKNITALSFCEVIISLYLIIYNIITMCFITGLLFYHCRLILINSTTKEELKDIFDNNYGNPYKRSICKNIKNVLCPKTKKYSIIDILSGNIGEICDYNNGDENDDNKPIYKNKEFKNNKNENTEVENATNAKFNLDNSSINRFNNISPDEKLKNINNSNHFSNDLISINRHKDNEMNDTKNTSFKVIDGNIEEYLKTFGTEIKSNL